MDKEEIIRRLKKISEHAVHFVGEPPFIIGLDDGIALDEAVSMLKEREAEGNKWIKCSDEMPKEQETIFAKFKGTNKWSPAMFAQSSEDVRVVIVFADGTRRVSHSHTIDGKWECEKSPLKRTVTHWMPNPELPLEGQ